jgi:hypothetical protein
MNRIIGVEFKKIDLILMRPTSAKSLPKEI